MSKRPESYSASNPHFTQRSHRGNGLTGTPILPSADMGLAPSSRTKGGTRRRSTCGPSTRRTAASNLASSTGRH